MYRESKGGGINEDLRCFAFIELPFVQQIKVTLVMRSGPYCARVSRGTGRPRFHWRSEVENNASRKYATFKADS